MSLSSAIAQTFGVPEDAAVPLAGAALLLCALAAYSLRCARGGGRAEAKRRAAEREAEAEQRGVEDAFREDALGFTDEDEREYGAARESDAAADPRGTLKKEYGVHIFYGTGPQSYKEWPKRVESEGGPGQVWREQMARLAPDPLTRPQVNVTAYTGKPGDVLVFPARARYSLGEGGLDAATVAAILSRHVPGLPPPTQPEQPEQVAGQPAPPPPLPEPAEASGCYLFVCVHDSRDRRCGVAGVRLAGALAAAARGRGFLPSWFKTFGCSHVGGHVFAGNVLVFADRRTVAREPGFDGAMRPGGSIVSGDWYGKVSDSGNDVRDLLDCIEAGVPYFDKWRGRTALSVRAAHVLLRNDDPDWRSCGDDCACAAAADSDARKEKFRVNSMTL